MESEDSCSVYSSDGLCCGKIGKPVARLQDLAEVFGDSAESLHSAISTAVNDTLFDDDEEWINAAFPVAIREALVLRGVAFELACTAVKRAEAGCYDLSVEGCLEWLSVEKARMMADVCSRVLMIYKREHLLGKEGVRDRLLLGCLSRLTRRASSGDDTVDMMLVALFEQQNSKSLVEKQTMYWVTRMCHRYSTSSDMLEFSAVDEQLLQQASWAKKVNYYARRLGELNIELAHVAFWGAYSR